MQNYNNDDDTNLDRPSVVRNPVTDNTTVITPTEKKTGLGIGAIVAIILVAIALFFVFRGRSDTVNNAGTAVGNTAGQVYNGTKDVAKEVPQAAKDAVTPGDQSTTRPNKDGSTKNLDQK